MKKMILNKTSYTYNMDQNCVSVVDKRYIQRKKMEPQYKELFKVLFTLPDKEVVNRVIAAINDDTDKTRQCTCKTRNISTHEVSTQTENITTNSEGVDVKNTESKTPVTCVHRPSSEDSLKSDADAKEGKQAAPTTTTTSEVAPKRKRRKRKMCMPQVSHVSQAQVLRKLQPKMSNRSDNDKVSYKKTENESLDCLKRPRSNSYVSLSDFSDIDTLYQDLLNPPKSPALDDIKNIMAREFCDSEDIIDGLLPIHIAISSNEIKKLQRQIFVWKLKKVDINELFTDDNQDCLQFAIVHNAVPQIVQILLEAELNVNCVDDHSNTIIHLAIFNEIDLQSMELLLEQIDLSILLKLNDKGHSPLHMAVRHDRYLHAELLMNAIDKRTLNKVIYKRQTEFNDQKSFTNRERKDEQQKAFLKYYENACDCLDTLEPLGKYCTKRKLLELGELCSGNTALFHALEDRMEHFIYFLLAHLSDPRTSNHSGQDAKSYFVEFSKSLTLSLKIDRTMEKVISFIQNSAK